MTSFQSFGVGQLVVGVDREARGSPLSIVPLGLSTVATESGVRTSSSDRPLATSLAGSSWMRIAGFCWPPIEHLRDAGDLADLLGELGLDVVVDLGQRQRVGGRAEQQDRASRPG